MSHGLRKFVAILLSVAIFFAGTGFGGMFANAIEHDLGIESSLGATASDDGGGAGICVHSCAAHLCIHFLALTEARPLPVQFRAVRSGAERIPDVDAGTFLPDSSFHPPRFSLV